MNVSSFMKSHHTEAAEFNDSIADEHGALEKAHEKIAGLHRSMQKAGSGDFADAHDELAATHGRLAARHKLHANFHRELAEKAEKERAAAKAVFADRDTIDFTKLAPRGVRGIPPGLRVIPREGQPSGPSDDLVPLEFQEMLKID